MRGGLFSAINSFVQESFNTELNQLKLDGLLIVFRRTKHLMGSIIMVIIASCFLIGFNYLVDIFHTNLTTQKKVLFFAVSYSETLYITPSLLIQCFYKFKNNGNFMTYLALHYSLYKIWLIKSTVLFIMVYSIFISSLFISFLALIILKTFGSIESIVFIESFIDIYGLIITGPILGISSYAFFGGLFLLIRNDIGEATILPGLFVVAISVGGIYILKNRSIFSFVTQNINFVFIILPLFLSFIFILLPKIIFSFFTPEKIILE